MWQQHITLVSSNFIIHSKRILNPHCLRHVPAYRWPCEHTKFDAVQQVSVTSPLSTTPPSFWKKSTNRRIGANSAAGSSPAWLYKLVRLGWVGEFNKQLYVFSFKFPIPSIWPTAWWHTKTPCEKLHLFNDFWLLLIVVVLILLLYNKNVYFLIRLCYLKLFNFPAA